MVLEFRLIRRSRNVNPREPQVSCKQQVALEASSILKPLPSVNAGVAVPMPTAPVT